MSRVDVVGSGRVTPAEVQASLAGLEPSRGPWGRFVSERVDLRRDGHHVEVFTDGDAEVLAVTLIVRDAYGTSREPLPQVTWRPLPAWSPFGARDFVRATLKRALMDANEHEIDETLFIDGRNAEPHKHDAETGATATFIPFKS